MQEKTLAVENTISVLGQTEGTVTSQDDSRPWGGFYVIQERQPTHNHMGFAILGCDMSIHECLPLPSILMTHHAH